MSRNLTKSNPIDQICAAVDRASIKSDNGHPEQIIVQRESYNNTKADLKQSMVIKFPPHVFPITSSAANTTFNQTVTLGDLVSAETIATATAAGAYAMRVSVKSHTAIISNLNNEISGSYDMTTVGTELVSGSYHYALDNVDHKLEAKTVNGEEIYQTSTMPVAQSLSTVLYNVIFDFNQVRAIAALVVAEGTMDQTVVAEVTFAYASAPVVVNTTSEKKSAVGSKRFF